MKLCQTSCKCTKGPSSNQISINPCIPNLDSFSTRKERKFRNQVEIGKIIFLASPYRLQQADFLLKINVASARRRCYGRAILIPDYLIAKSLTGPKIHVIFRKQHYLRTFFFSWTFPVSFWPPNLTEKLLHLKITSLLPSGSYFPPPPATSVTGRPVDFSKNRGGGKLYNEIIRSKGIFTWWSHKKKRLVAPKLWGVEVI